MDAQLGTVVELVVVVAIAVLALLYLRRRGVSTRRIFGIIVPGFCYILVVLILRLLGIPTDPWSAIILIVIVFAMLLVVAAWSRWQR